MRRAISPRLAIRIFLNIVGAGSWAGVKAFDDEQRLAELDRLAVLARICVTVPDASASISFMIFIASMMQSPARRP